jgi:hypothetical protein
LSAKKIQKGCSKVVMTADLRVDHWDNVMAALRAVHLAGPSALKMVVQKG